MIFPHKFIGVAVIRNDRGEILIDKRRQDGLMGGLWELPGGKIEPGETVEECIKREIWEELGIEIEVGLSLIVINHIYSLFAVTSQYINAVTQRASRSPWNAMRFAGSL